MSKHDVCPFWVGYLLASPLRRMLHDPVRILAGCVQPGMQVLDVGCAMGFFSLPMARMLAGRGRIVCVDVQPRMIEALARRARRAGVAERIESRLATGASLGVADLAGTIDFALAFAVVHEVPDAARLFAELRQVLRPGGRLLIAEPKGHVTRGAFADTLALAQAAGLAAIQTPRIPGCHATVLEAPGNGSRVGGGGQGPGRSTCNASMPFSQRPLGVAQISALHHA